MSWQQLSLIINKALVDEVETFLNEQGALAITAKDAEDNPILEPKPNQIAHWEQTELTALFEADASMTQIQHALATFLDDKKIAITTSQLADQVWEKAWLAHFKPMQFGNKLWICPASHELNENDDDKAIVYLDPGLAFGTGTHETTALCLEWLDQAALTGKTVIDYGCGSGILAIAALKLGAEIVHAIDYDPQALQATKENASRNHILPSQIKTYLPHEFHQTQADVLIANILVNPLIELEPTFNTLLKPSGALVLSGVLYSQEAELNAAYEKHFALESTEKRGDWLRFVYLKP